MKRKIGLIFLLLFLRIGVMAQNHPFDSGNGTLNNPYLISNHSQLDSLRNRLGDAYKELHYKLSTDINLNNTEWIPIGAVSTNAFKGKLHGNNKKITNLKIGTSQNNYEYAGLFGCLGDGAYFDSLEVSGTITCFQGNRNIGGIAGGAENIADTDSICFIACANNVKIEGAEGEMRIGGVVGACNNYIVMSHCVNHANITGYSGYIGGVFGFWQGATSTSVNDCSNYGDIAVNKGQFVGGIGGYYTGLLNGVFNCYNEGIITVNGPESQVTLWLGGIIGFVDVIHYAIADKVTISNCINEGDIFASEPRWGVDIGGVLGGVYADDFEVTNCKNFGNIIHDGGWLGGIIGAYTGTQGITYNCINDADIISSNAATTLGGGICGYAVGMSFENCTTHGEFIIDGSKNHSFGGICGEGKDVSFTNCANYINVVVQGDNAGDSRIAGICGYAVNGNFSNCRNFGNIVGSTTGGILGYGKTANNLAYCENRGAISGKETGGIVGRGGDGAIQNCINYANITGADFYAGGIAGRIYDNVSFSTVMYNINLGNISGDCLYAGGIAGEISNVGNMTTSIENCFHQGDILGSGNSGGIAGHVAANYGYGKVEIKNCYSHSLISSEKSNTTMGGITGFLESANSILIQNTYAYGSLNASDENAKVGGIAGYIADSEIKTYNSAAILDFINGSVENTHRIVGRLRENNGNQLSSNAAFERMYVNGLILTENIEDNTIEGGNITEENLHKLAEYPFLESSFTACNDDKTFPYLSFQSSPVFIRDLFDVEVSFDAYADSDSILIIKHPSNELVATLYGIRAGENIYGLAPFNIQGSDTLLFFNCEPSKSLSYGVSGIVEAVPVTGIQLNKSAITLIVNETEQLFATVLPANASNKNVYWHSSDNTIASVDNDGNVKGLSEGKTFVIAITEAGNFADTCAVTVNKGNSIFDANKKNIKIYPNPVHYTLHIQVDDMDAKIEKIILYDILGRMSHMSENLKSVKTQINVSYLPSGIYVAFIVLDNNKIIADRIYKK